MSKIILVTHAPIGNSLLEALRTILPNEAFEGFLIFDIQHQDDPETKVKEITDYLSSQSLKQLLLFTDLMGATPYHIARNVLQNIHHYPAALITGVSLPMAIKAVNYQHLPLDEWVTTITESVLEWVIIDFKRVELK